MKRCTKCEHEYADEFAFCPHCGEAYVEQSSANQSSISSVDNLTLVAKWGKNGAKVAEHEQKNHYIQNAIIFAMSLILFICSFFAGGLAQLELDGAKAPVSQTIFQIAEGSFAVADSDFSMNIEMINEVQIAIMNAYNVAFEELGEGNFDSKQQEDAFLAIVGRELSKSGVNISLYNMFLVRNALDSGMNNYYTAYAINEICGIPVTLLVLITQICLMITSLVFTIKSLILLINRKSVSNPFKIALLPLVFIFIRLVAFAVHPTILIDGAGIALVVISVLFVLILGAYKMVFTDHAIDFNVYALIKNATLFVIGFIAAFVTLGTVYNLTGLNTIYGSDVTSPITGNNILFYGILLNIKSVGSAQDTAPAILVNVSIYIMYVVLVAVGAKFAYCALKRATCAPSAKGNVLRQTKGSVIALIVFLSIILILTFILGSVLEKSSLYGHENGAGVSANMIVSLIMCIAFLIVDGVWKVKPTNELNEQTQNC